MPRPESLAVSILLTALVSLGPLSTDMYLPSMPALRQVFGASVPEIQLTLSVFLAGFAISQLVYGPLSDRFGRRPVVLGGLMIFAAASTACSFAPDIEWLVLGRFFQALGACCGPVVGRAIVR
ncbi:MAG: MFS transporter, partial [Alphaproteobacteria bacterium]